MSDTQTFKYNAFISCRHSDGTDHDQQRASCLEGERLKGPKSRQWLTVVLAFAVIVFGAMSISCAAPEVFAAQRQHPAVSHAIYTGETSIDKVTEFPENKTLIPARFSSDGQLVLTGTEDAAVLWSVDNGKKLRSFPQEDIFGFALSPDAQRVSTWKSFSEDVDLWSASTGKRLQTLSYNNPEHFNFVFDAVFSPNGQSLVTIYGQDAVVWSVLDGKKKYVFSHNSPVTHVVVSPEGRSVLTFDKESKNVSLWSLSTGEKLHTLKQSNLVFDAVFSPSGQTVVTLTRQSAFAPVQEAAFWDVSSGERRRSINLQQNPEYVKFSPNLKTLFAVKNEDAVLWSVENGETLARFNHPGLMYSASFSPDGEYVFVSSDKSSIIWSAKSGKKSRISPANSRASFSPDGKKVFISSEDGPAAIWTIAPHVLPQPNLSDP